MRIRWADIHLTERTTDDRDPAPVGFGRDIDCRAAGPALTADNHATDTMGTLAALNFLQEGDMIVADRDGVVVVPFAQIDAVIAALQKVRAAEAALDAQLADGLRFPEGVAQLIEGDDVQFVDG